MSVARSCRICGSPARHFELKGWGGGSLFLPFTPEFETTIGDEFSCDTNEPRWMCRYLDAHACSTCGACDLVPLDFATYLECDGRHLPHSPLICPACQSLCRGPIVIENDAAPGMPLAHLAPLYGAPLYGRVCEECGLTWLSLDPQDTEARRELAARFPEDRTCGRCRQGQFRVTNIDIPHSGEAGLYEGTNGLGDTGRTADVLIAICDACGESETHAKWRRPPPTTENRQPTT